MTEAPEAERPSELPTPIVFYDGECGFCNRSVRQLLGWDKNGLLYFAPLQGEAAAAVLPEDLRQELSTLVYYRGPDEPLLLRSDAVLRILVDIGKWPGLSRFALVFPRALRDAVYRLIAANRKRLPGSASCPVPSEDERRRFLD